MAGSLGLSGYIVLLVYMVAVVLLGLSFARKQKSLSAYFLAERAAPWWAVGISVLACDMSAISYLGAPSYTYYNDLRYPMNIFLAPLVALLVAVLFIPFLARLQVYTIYEYLEHRFSLSSRLFASALFSVQRGMHIAIAIYAISIALQQIIGWPVWACVTVIGSLTTLYTVLGGMKAVLWTDVAQFFVLVGGIFAMLGAVLWQFNGDVTHIWQVAAEASHTRLFSFDSNFFDARFWTELTIWALIFGNLVTNVASYGSDQVLVQRYIAAGSRKLMTRSLMFCAFLTIPVMSLLYFLGLGFFAYYHDSANSELLASLDRLIEKTNGSKDMIMPHFILHVLPSSLAGLVFAGLFAATMSVFSSGLNSLSTVTCMDFIDRLRRLHSNPNAVTLASARRVTLAWGVAVTMASIGVHFFNQGSVVVKAFTVISFFSGPLLGMFLLGMFSLRANSTGAILGALSGFAAILLLRNYVSFVWTSVVGCVPAVICGYLFSYFAPREEWERVYPMTVWARIYKSAPQLQQPQTPEGNFARAANRNSEND
jgi:SSS family transporter